MKNDQMMIEKYPVMILISNILPHINLQICNIASANEHTHVYLNKMRIQ